MKNFRIIFHLVIIMIFSKTTRVWDFTFSAMIRKSSAIV